MEVTAIRRGVPPVVTVVPLVGAEKVGTLGMLVGLEPRGAAIG